MSASTLLSVVPPRQISSAFSSGGGGGGSGVSSVNAVTGAVTVTAGAAIDVQTNGQDISIINNGVQSLTVGGSETTGAIELLGGLGISVTKNAQQVTVASTINLTNVVDYFTSTPLTYPTATVTSPGSSVKFSGTYYSSVPVVAGSYYTANFVVKVDTATVTNPGGFLEVLLTLSPGGGGGGTAIVATSVPCSSTTDVDGCTLSGTLTFLAPATLDTLDISLGQDSNADMSATASLLSFNAVRLS